MEAEHSNIDELDAAMTYPNFFACVLVFKKTVYKKEIKIIKVEKCIKNIKRENISVELKNDFILGSLENKKTSTPFTICWSM